ncbi:hypothetical protein SAMN05518668_10386 [Sphingobium sp. YR657]|uniref:Uncharacterized protein n=1 Tax=Sphingobium yanoikuyae ATCC 51230 TaxID=883163 RepID=K9CW63_SPHYA|nr:hypothetical protein HMPREF9718_00788 [Sphingobium yanoikuyae ATCC 51230]SHL78697.1 hypothetical protein SAMN05518668_10386 [Sphingobium sp. YR657]
MRYNGNEHYPNCRLNELAPNFLTSTRSHARQSRNSDRRLIFVTISSDFIVNLIGLFQRDFGAHDAHITDNFFVTFTLSNVGLSKVGFCRVKGIRTYENFQRLIILMIHTKTANLILASRF